jgi:hypothetical protein
VPQPRQQRLQCQLRVALEIDFHRIAQAQLAPVDVDLHAARLLFLGQEFRIGKAGTDHQQRVAVLHQLPARVGPEQADGAGHERQFVGHRGLAEQCLGDPGAELLGGFDDFRRRVHRAGAGQDRDLFAGVQHLRRALQVVAGGHDVRPAVTGAAEYAAVLARRDFDRLQFLDVVGNDDAGHAAQGLRDAHRAVYRMAHLFRHGHHVHVLVRHVLEQRDQVHFLLVVAADRHARRLADDGHYRLVVQLGVVEPVQQMDRPRARGRETYPDFAGELRVRAGHEGRAFLVPHLDEFDQLRMAVQRAHDAVDAVAGITVDSLHAPPGEAVDHEIADFVHKCSGSFSGCLQGPEAIYMPRVAAPAFVHAASGADQRSVPSGKFVTHREI